MLMRAKQGSRTHRGTSGRVKFGGATETEVLKLGKSEHFKQCLKQEVRIVTASLCRCHKQHSRIISIFACK